MGYPAASLSEIGSVVRSVFAVLVLFLVGCSSEPVRDLDSSSNQRGRITSGEPWVNKTATQVDDNLEVYPFTINLPRSGHYEPYADYLLPLLRNLSQKELYRLKNGHRLRSAYRYVQQVSSRDNSKTVLALKQQGASNWGYVTTSIGRSGIANAFVVDQAGNKHYVLVIKRMRICLVSKAAGAPKWRNGKWLFSENPGVFECTGSARLNVFQQDSGFPGLLGPYFDENDTVLVFTHPAELKGMLFALKRQFPQLIIPRV